MKQLLVVVGLAILFAIVAAPVEASTGLKIQPLEYSAELGRAQTQRGVIDISNPLDEPVEVKTSVQAVRQVNNDGELEFYDDEAIEAGVRLDKKQFSLPAKGAYRLVFELDGSRLPSGDSVAAIFVQTVGAEGSLSGSARVGTLVFITNGTLAGRQVAITDLSIDRLQTDGGVSGSYRIANTADSKRSTGFRPEVTVQLTPLHQTSTSTGPLVFSGRERTVGLSLPTKAVGVYKLTVSSGDSQQSRWILLLPTWSILIALGLLILVAGGRYAWRRRVGRTGFGSQPESQSK